MLPTPVLKPQQPQTISEGHRGTGNAALLWADQLSPSARNSAAALSLRLIFLRVDGAWSGVAIVMGASWMLCCCFLRDSLNTLMGCSLISTRATASPQLLALLLVRPKDSGDPGCSVPLLLLALADDFLQSGASRLGVGVPRCWLRSCFGAAAARSNEGRKMSCVKTIVMGVKRKLRSRTGRTTEQSKTSKRALELEGWLGAQVPTSV